MNRLLDSEVSAVRGELVKVDGKCATLASLAGAAVAFVATQVDGRMPVAPRLILGAAGVVLTAATVILLVCVLRPRLGSTGFRRYAAMTGEQINHLFQAGPDTPNGDDPETFEATDLAILSRLCNVKYVRLRLALDLIAAGVLLIGAAIIMRVIV